MSAPDGLSERGAALWVALARDLDSAPGAVALEACRTVDRLDELDRIIAGKGVLNLMAFRLGLDEILETGEREIHVTVGFQNVLAEARQQQGRLSGLLATLANLDGDTGAPPAPEEASPLAQVLALVQSGAKPPGRPS